jgi:type VI secretion system secreted protein Hcp
MAALFYVAIEGTKQGVFKGTTEAGPEPYAGRIHGLDFRYEAARTAARPGRVGGRKHGPVVLTKAWDAATPLLFNAFVSSEALSVSFEFVAINDDGIEFIVHTIDLKDAWISHLDWYLADEPEPGDHGGLEDVSFSFDQIRVENIPGQTEAADSWPVYA